jgi:hypothetical protein
MKRKILLLTLLMGSIGVLEAKITIYKNGWGLFRRWYDYVEQTAFNNGDVVVVCQRPGFVRCAVQNISSIVFQGNPTPLTQEKLDIISDYVENSITETKNSGAFIYDNSYYVRYGYNITNDKLTTDVYSLQEARSLKLIP